MEFHASYKNICDEFAIDLLEYEQIFSMDISAFKVLDPTNRGRVDVFEVFSALVLFGRMDFAEKLRLLFEFFDLNASGRLSSEEIEFMLNAILCAVFKVKAVGGRS